MIPEWRAEAVWGSAYPTISGNFNANSKKFCVCRTIVQIFYQSQDARSGDIASLSRREIAARNSKRELDDARNECALAKITKTPVSRVAGTQAEEKLEMLFTDVMGTFREESLPVFRFCILFADQYRKFVFVDLLRAKSEALASLKKFVLNLGTPKKLRQDNAKEFLSDMFMMYFIDAVIQQEKAIPETPQQNGLAERCNRTLLEMARCLLIDSCLPKMIWGAAILHATRIRNLVVRRREEKCPTELMRAI